MLHRLSTKCNEHTLLKTPEENLDVALFLSVLRALPRYFKMQP
jgi:hypothetical protein